MGEILVEIFQSIAIISIVATCFFLGKRIDIANSRIDLMRKRMDMQDQEIGMLVEILKLRAAREHIHEIDPTWH